MKWLMVRLQSIIKKGGEALYTLLYHTMLHACVNTFCAGQIGNVLVVMSSKSHCSEDHTVSSETKNPTHLYNLIEDATDFCPQIWQPNMLCWHDTNRSHLGSTCPISSSSNVMTMATKHGSGVHFRVKYVNFSLSMTLVANLACWLP